MNRTLISQAKVLLSQSLASIFAGLTFSPKASAFDTSHGTRKRPHKFQRDDNGCYGRPAKFDNNKDPACPKYDFIRRAPTKGMGYFRNRSNGEIRLHAIANPAPTAKRRPMPRSESIYFGLEQH